MARRISKGVALAVVLTVALVAVVWGPSLWHLYGDRLFSNENCTATVDGASDSLTAEQTDNAALIVAIATSRDLPAKAATVALATALQESDLRNLRVGDRDSLGLFQQRPSQGWGTEDEVLDPYHATNAFYDALLLVDGWEAMSVTAAAQAVQRSAFPEAYAQHEERAEVWALALAGAAGIDSVSCSLEPVSPTSNPDIAFLERSADDFGDLVEARIDRSNPNLVMATLVVDPPLSVAVANWTVAMASTHPIVAVSSCDMEWTREREGWGNAPPDQYPSGCDSGEVYVVLSADRTA
jgi:hypothetical protein